MPAVFFNLDQNEANVSNFRDVVSVVLPFEGERNQRGYQHESLRLLKIQQNNESTLILEIPTKMKV